MELKIQVDAKAVIIPDLWFIARGLGLDTPEGKAVLATWHLAYDLRNALTNLQKE